MTSIRLRLLKWLIAPVLLINVVGGVLAYKMAVLSAQTATTAPATTGTTAAAGAPAGADRKHAQLQTALLRALLMMEGVFAIASIGLVWFSVSNGLRPLSRLRADLGAREADDLAPLDPARVPYELVPVVSAMNGLLEKVGEGARARQDFLANVAHQLRTPLAGLKTQLEWLDARHAEPETAQSLRLMQAATERMIRQTNQLLSLARAEPHHFEKARLEPLALDALVGEAIQPFVEQAARKGIDLGFELQPALVSGDRFLLRDLIDNLIDNALRYTPAGGTVTVRCGPAGEGALLEVEDNGPGIPAARRADIFSRYVRLDDKSHGSGLGLAIVRDIATVHGAGLTVGHGAQGRGALFAVRFAGGT
ncbi:ATP-binding protein [Duganella sp. Leaf126]|uniref:sensor histidine kinase n=1 Tax=Duganella sp. Leaf126 TaxID=1736266 RepID=UPI0006FF9540|nr:HAMP domain-containing sensor histidine kinase [Duganella sp. Leaf126]KQQ36080.1 ATP-binding protein [Duganella sp. Leaf126]